MTPEQFQRQTGISDKSLTLFKQWYGLLSRWNRKINLVASASIHDFWLRHALDSWQIVALLPDAESVRTQTLLDMGAGAGFPGLALAIGLKESGHKESGRKESGRKESAHKNNQATQITLVEANAKKCNFLRTVIRELDLPAKALQARMETLHAPSLTKKPYDIITARAFAPLPKLLGYSLPFWHTNTVALFSKGENWQAETTKARKLYNFDLSTTKSQTNENAMILQITNLRRKEGAGQ